MEDITAAPTHPGTRASTKTPAKPLLVCYSHLRWNFVYQRPQHLMSRAARTYEVVFVEEPLVAQVSAPRLELRSAGAHLTIAVPLLPEALAREGAVAAQRLLLDDLLATFGRRPRVCWYYTPMALEFSRHVDADAVVYDSMDELAAFRHAPAALRVLEDELFERCDLVFCGGLSLYEAKRSRHPDVHPFPSSIDRRHFAKARRRPDDPADQAALPRPRLGYFGVIDERMDLDLLDEVARRRRDWQWVMLGPTAKIDPDTLPRHPNLHWLGSRSYAALPAYLAHWDVGIMPFALNESTRFISPTKTPEFLAAGVPVVSSAVRDVVRSYGRTGMVEIASGADDWIACIDTLLQRPRAAWLKQVDTYLSTTSWETTWQAMHRRVASVLKAARGRHQGGSLPLQGAVLAPAASLTDAEGAGHV